MSELFTCHNCSGEVTEDSDFCPHCGLLFNSAQSAMCEIHTDQQAVGVCILCHQPVCKSCSSMTMGRTFCKPHDDIAVVEDWAMVFEATDIVDAGLARELLISNGFKVQVQNFNSIGFVWDGGGDSIISRSNLSKPAKVFVPIPDYFTALELLESWSESNLEEEGNEQEND
ncbi:MAG: hypothetical protein V1799_02760 [bacterium]